MSQRLYILSYWILLCAKYAIGFDCDIFVRYLLLTDLWFRPSVLTIMNDDAMVCTCYFRKIFAMYINCYSREILIAIFANLFDNRPSVDCIYISGASIWLYWSNALHVVWFRSLSQELQKNHWANGRRRTYGISETRTTSACRTKVQGSLP